MQNTDASEPVTRFKATGINIIVAAGLVAAIGDIRRFSSPQKLVSYVGLNPRVRQSGLGLAQHGRISKRGRSHARAMSQTRRKLPPTAQRLIRSTWAQQRIVALPNVLLRNGALTGEQILEISSR